MNFDAAIFDLDGTLLDSLEDIANAANQVLEDLGRPTHPIADYRYLVGDGVAVLFQRALPECSHDPRLHERCMSMFEAAYATQWHNRSKPYDGIVSLLKRLRQSNLQLAVLSNKPDGFTKKCVEHFFGEIDFRTVVGHSPQFPRKPDPQSARWIGTELGFPAHRIAYIGDTNTDMKTAVGASFHAMGVSWGFRTKAELLEHGARVVYDSVFELGEGLIGS